MKMRYSAKREVINSEEFGEYITYGIQIYNDGELIREISDVSTSERKVADLCECCNRLKLDPIHIDDVIEDIL